MGLGRIQSGKGAGQVKRAPVLALTRGLITLLVVIPGIFEEAGATNPVLMVGEFSNMRFTAEHAYGGIRFGYGGRGTNGLDF
jgi:hypothetical protein